MHRSRVTRSRHLTSFHLTTTGLFVRPIVDPNSGAIDRGFFGLITALALTKRTFNGKDKAKNAKGEAGDAISIPVRITGQRRGYREWFKHVDLTHKADV
jgi:hypothetical protein